MNGHNMAEAQPTVCSALNDGWELLGDKRLNQERKLQMPVSSVGQLCEE